MCLLLVLYCFVHVYEDSSDASLSIWALGSRTNSSSFQMQCELLNWNLALLLSFISCLVASLYGA